VTLTAPGSSIAELTAEDMRAVIAIAAYEAH
jgi:hypothetical protein